MLNRYERREYQGRLPVFVGYYKNLENENHFHEEVELCFVEKGEALVTMDSKSYSLHAKEGLFIASGKIHSIKGAKDSLLLIVMVDPSLEKTIFTGDAVDPFLVGIDYGKLVQGYLEEEESSRLFKERILGDMFVDFFIRIFRKNGRRECQEVENEDYRRMKAILAEIDSDIAHADFKTLAKKFSYSPSYFSRLFNRLIGTAFTDYVNDVRIDKAISLLREGKKSVTEIALEVGFNSLRNFNRVFRKRTGYTPTTLAEDYELDLGKLRIFPNSFNPTKKGSLLLPREDWPVSKKTDS